MQKYVNTSHIKIFVWLSFSHGAHQSHMTRFCTCCLIKFTRQTHSPLLVIYKSVFITQVLWFTRQLTAGWRWHMPKLSGRKKLHKPITAWTFLEGRIKQNKTTTAKNFCLFKMSACTSNALRRLKSFSRLLLGTQYRMFRYTNRYQILELSPWQITLYKKMTTSCVHHRSERSRFVHNAWKQT